MIEIRKGGQIQKIPHEEVKNVTGATFLSSLRFEKATILEDIRKRVHKAKVKSYLTKQQVWFGAFFQKEILSTKVPDVYLEWIDDEVGWGVFAKRLFRKMEFITEYTGVVRKRVFRDRKNAYCFEYIVSQEILTPYTIDAKEAGGISRYINHSTRANLVTALATFDDLCHIVIYAKTEIAKDQQLLYDYGPDYWAKRDPARALL